MTNKSSTYYVKNFHIGNVNIPEKHGTFSIQAKYDNGNRHLLYNLVFYENWIYVGSKEITIQGLKKEDLFPLLYKELKNNFIRQVQANKLVDSLGWTSEDLTPVASSLEWQAIHQLTRLVEKKMMLCRD